MSAILWVTRLTHRDLRMQSIPDDLFALQRNEITTTGQERGYQTQNHVGCREDLEGSLLDTIGS